MTVNQRSVAALSLESASALDIRGWLRDGLFVGHSCIQGSGLFTNTAIAPGEPVIRWGGKILPVQARTAGGVRDHTAVAISEGVIIASLPDEEPTPDDYMNHSCDSNLWMLDALTLCARREICAGEELTADYALWMDDETYVMRRQCNCGASVCRSSVTGKDWLKRTVRTQYEGHFSPFIARRIAASPTRSP